MKSFAARKGWLLVCTGVLLGWLGVGQETWAAKEPDKHLTFTVTANLYADVFADANAPGQAADKPLEVRRGETILLTIEGKPAPGWHTYPIRKRTKDQITQSSEVMVQPSEAFAGFWSQKFEGLWPVVESEPKLAEDKDNGFEYDGPFTWSMVVLVRPTATVGKADLAVNLKTQVCEKSCLNEKYTLNIPITIMEGEVPLSPEVAGLLDKYDEEAKERARRENPATPRLAESFNWRELTIVDQTKGASGGGETGLWATLVTALFGGLIALATPCVFPMIPITVSFFLKQAEEKHRNAWVMAAVYSGTIVLVLTAGGIALVSVLQTISQHWITNVFLAGVFIVFALSLLGMFDLALPTSLADRAQSGTGKGGYVGIVFMALTFSIISFACVGPIYGAFIGLEASQQSAVAGWLRRILGPLAFSLAFASPFFVLALFPQLLKSMPKSGSWMNSVKVVMGFLELAAAFKFIRSAEVSFFAKTDLFTYDFVLGIYVALSIACGLYLLGVYRLPHDHEAPESIGVLRLVFSLIFLSFGLYLLPGLFKDDKQHSQRPRGTVYAWVQAFLLPDDPSTWEANLYKAMAQAEKENKPLFIDFTGVTCPNCKLNENNVFAKPRFEELFRRYVTVQLHTDVVPAGVSQEPNAKESAAFRDDKLNNIALPYYVIVRVKGKTLYVLYKHEEGIISNVDAFAAALNKYATKPQS